MALQPARRVLAASSIAATLAMLAPLVLQAQAQTPSRAEQLIKYRQAIYTVLVGNFSPIGAMVTGKAPFDAKEAAMRAERVSFMAQLLEEAYPEESRQGAPTRAKGEIWSNRAEFDRLLEDMQTQAAGLAEVTRTGDESRIRTALRDLGQACKACHDRFRES